jgi:hypothetical protein
LVGRRRGVLRLRDDGGDYEGCCQCGGGNRIFEETILRESIFEETRGRHVFRLPALLRLSGTSVVQPDFAESKAEFQPGRFALIRRSVD